MHVGLHHAEKREKEGTANFFDRLMIVVGLIGPLSLIPQILEIWNSKNIDGISLLSWVLLTLVSFMWMIYGIFHRSKALIVSNLLLIIMNLLIVVGVLMVR